jgi:hypothetical protein
MGLHAEQQLGPYTFLQSLTNADADALVSDAFAAPIGSS